MFQKQCKICNRFIDFSNYNDEKSAKSAHLSIKYCNECASFIKKEQARVRNARLRKRQKILHYEEKIQNSILIDGELIEKYLYEKGSRICHYVYWFKHPLHEYLYIGKSDYNFGDRITRHLTDKCDNIERKYLALLLESEVYTCCVSNKTESDLLESLLINQYKPFLNKKKKYESCSLFFDIKLNWEKFDISKYVKNIENDKINQGDSKNELCMLSVLES